MANVIGSLLVELGINTAAFADGMSKATYSAKEGARQIGDAFRGIGSTLASLGSNFGEFGSVVASSLTTIGSSMGRLVKSAGDMSGMSGALKAGAIGFGALGAGAVTAGVAVIGIAAHAAEGAARLYELSQSTGIGIKALSGLGAVGETVGVSTDQLGHALERMSRSAIIALEHPTNQAAVAFKTLGISLTDANGKVKGTSDLFTELAGKFSAMEDGPAKTAIAMQIFGRAGAEIIPLLNKGADGLKYWVDYATQVGAVLDDKAAAGAHAFSEEMAKLSLLSQGVQNRLMEALLPALDHVVAAFTTLFGKGPQAQLFGQMVSDVLMAMANGLLNVVGNIDALENKWVHLNAFAQKFENKHTTVGFQIFGNTSFQGMTDAQIDEAVKKADADQQKVQDQLAVARADLNSKAGITAPGPAESGNKSPAPNIGPVTAGAAVKTPIDEVKKYLDALSNEVDVQQQLATMVGKTTEQIRQQEAAAQAEGEYFKMHQGLEQKLAQTEQSLTDAKANGTAKSDVHVRQLEAEKTSLTSQLKELEANRQKIIQLNEAKADASGSIAFQKQMVSEEEKIRANITAMNAEVAAMFDSAEAKRKAAAQAKVAQLTSQAPAGTDLSGVVKAVNDEVDAQNRLAVAKEAAALATRKGYDDEVALIKQAMAAYSDNRDIQLAGDAALQEAANKVTQAWDQNALKFGTAAEKAKAVLNELNIESQNTGAKIAGSFKTAVDGISKNFADMVTTGKSNFKALFLSLEQSIVQALASKALNDLIQKLADLALPGVGGGGSSGGSSGGGGGNPLGGIMNFLGGLIPHASGGPVAPGVGYLVGEKGPEAFVPSVPGTIVPNSATMKGSPMQGNVNVHVYGATDPDSFRKASPQIATAVWSQMRMAAARNQGGS